jgi:Tfp pilus assembly protein PilX
MKNINTRLKMALLLQSQEAGFAIVIAVSLGLIMILVGLTMTLRSQGDQVISSTQKQTDEALAAAEKGVTFYQNFFNANAVNRQLVKFPDCNNPPRDNEDPGTDCDDPTTNPTPSQLSWSNADRIRIFNNICNTASFNTIKNVYASTDWKDANDPLDTDPNVSSQQQFRLVAYKPIVGELNNPNGIAQVGRLIVEGRMNPDSNIINQSVSRLEVTFPIRNGDTLSSPVPGVWLGGTADDDGTANNKISANILLNSCNILADDLTRMRNNLRDFPDGSRPKIDQTEIQLPPVPAAPAVRRIGSPANAPSSTNPFNPNSDRPGHIPLSAISGNTTITLPDESANYGITPPKVPDSRFRMTHAGVSNVYVYKVPSITGGNVTIRIKPNTKIMLYLDNEIRNNVSIVCETADACNPMDTIIFGTSTASDPKICINGSNSIEAFIFAPNYRVGVASGTPNPVNGISNFLGAVWSKGWGGPQCGSTGPASDNSGFLAVQQRGSWQNIPGSIRGNINEQYPPEVDATGSWERKEVD